MRKRLQASPRREGFAGLRKQAKQASPRGAKKPAPYNVTRLIHR